MPPPSAQGDADRAGLLCTKLEPPRGRHVEACDFANDGAEAAVAQAFLDTGEHGLVVARLDIDDAVGCKAGLSERRCEKIWSGDNPEDFASGAGRDPSRKKRRRCAVDRAVTAAGDFVQRAERQAPARESRVHLGDSERKYRFHAPASAFDLLDLRAQRLDGGLGPQLLC